VARAQGARVLARVLCCGGGPAEGVAWVAGSVHAATRLSNRRLLYMALHRAARAPAVLQRPRLSACVRARAQEFCEQAAVKSRAEYDEMYARSLADPQGFWGDLAKQFHWCVLALLLLRQRRLLRVGAMA